MALAGIPTKYAPIAVVLGWLSTFTAVAEEADKGLPRNLSNISKNTPLIVV